MSELRRLRIDAHLSIDQLAALSKVSPEQIRNIETGRARNPRVATLTALSAVLRVQPSELGSGADGTGRAACRGAVVTRLEKVARAQQLRAEGHSYPQIARVMGIGRQTVWDYVNDPTLSGARARKASYAGTCDLCGGPTSGCNGPGRTAKTCKECLCWPDEAIVDAIRRWAEARGGIPPTRDEWTRSGVDHPCATVVDRRFGWNNALLRAGFGLKCDRRPETQQWIERQLRAGVPTAEIADALGVTPAAIHMRMRYRGTTVVASRAAA